MKMRTEQEQTQLQQKVVNTSPRFPAELDQDSHSTNRKRRYFGMILIFQQSNEKKLL
jgi:hypothetical protein